ncbi:ribonuclease H-like domain-containing protein [Mycena sp. CBHHK59/15]|nr:ribonuclease H-like domain-containing protein [Mycena sp. CBHHK59/15]
MEPTGTFEMPRSTPTVNFQEDNTSRKRKRFKELKVEGGQVSDRLSEETSVKNLPPFTIDFDIHYIMDEESADNALCHIIDGIVGFDTEYEDRIPTEEEETIHELFGPGSASRRSAILAWQMIQIKKKTPISWPNIGLRIVQIARGNNAWVINIFNMKAFPKELKRILTSDNIVKTGVGLSSDVTVMWNDMHIDLRNLVDAGLIAKLIYCEEFGHLAYGNLSLQTCVELIFKMYVDKKHQTGNWTGEDSEQNKVHSKEQILYAIASLRLYDKLIPLLETKGSTLGRPIPSEWYSFNAFRGDLFRRTLTVRGETVPWSIKDCSWFFGGKFQGYFF